MIKHFLLFLLKCLLEKARKKQKNNKKLQKDTRERYQILSEEIENRKRQYVWKQKEKKKSKEKTKRKQKENKKHQYCRECYRNLPEDEKKRLVLSVDKIII